MLDCFESNRGKAVEVDVDENKLMESVRVSSVDCEFFRLEARRRMPDTVDVKDLLDCTEGDLTDALYWEDGRRLCGDVGPNVIGENMHESRRTDGDALRLFPSRLRFPTVRGTSGTSVGTAEPLAKRSKRLCRRRRYSSSLQQHKYLSL